MLFLTLYVNINYLPFADYCEISIGFLKCQKADLKILLIEYCFRLAGMLFFFHVNVLRITFKMTNYETIVKIVRCLSFG